MRMSDVLDREWHDALAIQCRRAVRDEGALRAALQQADCVPQLLVQAQLSGDTDLLDQAAPYIHGGWSFMEEIPPVLRRTITERLIGTLKACADGDPAAAPPRPSRETVARLLSVGVGELVPDDYVPLIFEEMTGWPEDTRDVTWRRPVEPARAGPGVVIVGAGLSGICLAIKLRQAQIPFVIFEKNDAVGGTWYENSYPGCAVDIPTQTYSFSFEPKLDWSRHFATRGELWSYLEQCADKYDIRRDIHFGMEVTDARFDEERSLWQIVARDRDGTSHTTTSPVFVPAVGQLNRPSKPRIAGLDTFPGPVFHTAEWDHDVDVSGRRVALVGTGASSMQVGPAIAGKVDRLVVFQRTPNWAGLNKNYHETITAGMKWALANVPHFRQWHRALLFWASGDIMHPTIQVDPAWSDQRLSISAPNRRLRDTLTSYIRAEIGERTDLLDKVIPDYPPYGKRMLRDNYWYRMLKRDNVDLIASGVERIENDTLIDQNGGRHRADIIVLATGFQAGRMLWPMNIVGRGGRSIRDLWGDDDPRAYLGMTVPGFPNMFILYGPNTGLGHGGGLFFHAECQVRYIMQCLRELIEGGHATMECRAAVFDEYNRRVDEAHGRMVWTHGGVRNWYKNSRGRVVANSPWRLVDYWKLTSALNPHDFIYTP